MLRATKIEKSYGSLAVLKGIDLEIHKGEIVAIVGASGAGKSTLLHILGTLDHPDKGKVFIHDKDVFGQSSKGLAAFRNKSLGFVFQFHNLLPEFSALENVMIPGLIGNKDERKGTDWEKWCFCEEFLDPVPARSSPPHLTKGRMKKNYQSLNMANYGR